MWERKTGIGRRVAASLVVVGIAALSGCTAVSQGSPVRASGQLATVPDVSAHGRLDYACALAIDANSNHGRVDSWNIAVGDDADPVMHEVAGAGGLLSGFGGARLEHHQNLSKAAQSYYSGLMQIDTARMQRGLDDLVTGCRRDRLPVHEPDVSAGGRITYACALASDVEAHGGPVENWVGGRDKTLPAAYELAGSVALLGAWSGSHLKGHRNLSDTAIKIMQDTFQFRPTALRHNVHQLVRECAEL
jgi:hypothetical protein